MNSRSVPTPARKAETSSLSSLLTSETPVQRQGVVSLGSVRKRAVGQGEHALGVEQV
jgi:hypothetical protein